MSRCFPFPPPGYEKKTRIDDTNLLTKETQKEKKHKKDKKDKERKDKKNKEQKDKKEKNDKDRRKEKLKEKKDRKEKHKDKDKDKTQLSDERRVDKQTPVCNEEKFSSNSVLRNENDDSKYVQELARRIKDEDKISGSEMLQNLASDQRGAGLVGKPFHDEEKFSSTSMQRDENNNSKHVQELARRNRDGDGISGSKMFQRNSASDQREAGFFGKPVQSSIGKQSVENDGFRFKNEDRKKINEQRNHVADRGLGKEFGEILHRDKERVDGIPIPMEKAPDKLVERKDTTKSKDSSIKGDKLKNRDKEKDRKLRDKDQNKEKKKKGKTKEITELSKELPKIRESGLNQKLKENSKGSLDSQHTNSLAGSKSSSPGSSSQGNLCKRKEFEMNGYMLENGIQPNKFPRAFSASAPTVENGRKLKSSRTPIQFALEEQGPASNSESDTADCKINGSKVAQQSDPSPSLPVTVPLPSKSLVSQNGGETSAKPPHPDTKYLSQILSVPAMEDFPDVDDQEWLFRSNMQLNKSDKSSPGVEEMQYVWSEARWIESAAISALPYVIPY